MYHPGSTYRIQFNKDFSLEDFEKIADYLLELGIKTVYASPVFSAVPGSNHGYDVTDPNSIDKEIGTFDQLKRITGQLKDRGMGWLQDIVPNHMAYHPDNSRLMDALEKGPDSVYAAYFDIDWHHPFCPGKIMLPILDKPLEKAIEDGAIKIGYAGGKLLLLYKDAAYPMKADPYAAGLLEDEQEVSVHLEKINNDKDALADIINKQYYLLCEWKETNEHINYRRFFTINGMISLNTQDEKVFEEEHELIRKMIVEGIIQGVRVDHVDGLYDPTEYLCRLRALTGDETYICVEKILQPGEKLPAYWPVQGTTGYDFIAITNSLFTAIDSAKKINCFYKQIVLNQANAQVQSYDKKSMILHEYMQGDLENLYRLFSDIASDNNLPREKMMDAIGAFLVYCPVYRFYSNKVPVDRLEFEELKKLFDTIKKANPDLEEEIALLRKVLLMQKDIDESKNYENVGHFFKRCMQFTSPLMAKGVEDTLMYTYNRAIAHNEVGDALAVTSSSIDKFHALIFRRSRKWPFTMNATATHDTKRGEDARARLHVLSNMPDEWVEQIKKWFDLNQQLKVNNVPDLNDEYFIYQALVASHPMPGEEMGDFEKRFQAYIQKVLREAKVHTNWENPNKEYEQSVAAFVNKLLQKDSPFMQNFLPFHVKVADKGIVNSLSQLVLKCTCPGIPDIYQGCELWDLSMVDPDNRRPVNYEIRHQWLNEILDGKHQPETLWSEKYSGKIKLWLLHHLLKMRNDTPELFDSGTYIPLTTTGKYKDNIIAYARHLDNKWCIVVLPLHAASLGDINSLDWKDTSVTFPNGMVAKYECTFSGKPIFLKNTMPIKDLFQSLPFAVLYGVARQQERAAGVLLPLFSVHSPFGIGDFGRGAKDFADFLRRSGQKYWQLLPLNPVDKEGMFSPYSSMSSMACNPLLISPEMLAEEKLIHKADLKKYNIPDNGKVDYNRIREVKLEMLKEAYDRFCRKNFMELRYSFETFCKAQDYWLRDYALFVALKSAFNNKSWNNWPDKYKQRNPQALADFEREHAKELHEIKWIQFITFRQWSELKSYCNSRQIQLFGDLPFYVSYDSVDVWSNPEMFSLDKDGSMIGVAGVPPDYFSEDGQLWGVPTYNWQKLKENDYDWWALRLKKNIELFDLVRIDHFRALQTYWQVPAGETTAKNGKWIKGPGIEFFKAMKDKLGKLPFIAEDLGYEMDEEYLLRDEAGLPGMKVLQFAWGDNISTCVDTPHNYPINCVVYTGTHDNNTTLGWFRNETTPADRKRLHEYTGRRVNDRNVVNVMTVIAYASVASVGILPMQDILGLNEKARMNTPGTVDGNWQWRLPDKALTAKVENYLFKLASLYNRI